MPEPLDNGYCETSSSPPPAYLMQRLRGLLDKEKNRCILDLGCGSGSVSGALIDMGFDVYGLDPSESGVKIAGKKYPGRFFIKDINSGTLPKELEDLPFDTILSTEVIEHLCQPRKLVRFAREILLRHGGGQLIISTPYHGYLKNLALALTGKMDSHFTALWDGGHVKFFSKKTLALLVEEQGFIVHSIQGAGRIPLLWKTMVLNSTLH